MLGWIDWTATGSWMQAWASLAQAGAVLLVGRAALKGWRQEKIGERRIDAAEHLLTLTYKAREAFRYIRREMMSQSERRDAELTVRRELSPTSVLTSNLVSAQVFVDRLNQSEALWSELIEALPRARALFPEAVVDSCEKLLQQRRRLALAASAYGNDAGEDRERTLVIESDLWSWGAEEGRNNPMDDAIVSAVATIESLLLPELRSSS